MPIVCLAVGRKHEDWVLGGIQRYEKRLKPPFKLEWVLLPHSSREGSEARLEESERIHKHLKGDDIVILLDERGEDFTSPQLSKILDESLSRSQRIVLVIGGAYGVTDELRSRASKVWSLSKLVFPHQLVRLMLTEQIYRSQEISSGGPYHHD